MNTNIIQILATTNNEQYNYLKLLEELAELQEVLLKKILKKGGPKEPSDQDVIEEIGDVEIRLTIFKEMWCCHSQVDERIKTKLDAYTDYLNKGLYSGSI